MDDDEILRRHDLVSAAAVVGANLVAANQPREHRRIVIVAIVEPLADGRLSIAMDSKTSEPQPSDTDVVRRALRYCLTSIGGG